MSDQELCRIELLRARTKEMDEAWKRIEAKVHGTPPYPWCSQPDVCIPKGHCPRDPNCGE